MKKLYIYWVSDFNKKRYVYSDSEIALREYIKQKHNSPTEYGFKLAPDNFIRVY